MNQLIKPTNTNFPVIDFQSLGFDDPNVRLIQDEILKFTDGHWSSRSGIVFQHGTVMLAAFTAHAVQHFEFDGPVMKDTVVKMSSKELPDIEELNSKIPREEWNTDRFGNTNPPWRHQYIVYLEDPQTASLYTYINSTGGAEIAVGKLEGQLKRMTWLCGKRLGAVVELHEQLVSKQYKKMGPRFQITGWFELVNVPAWLASSAPEQLEHEPIQQIEHTNTWHRKSEPIEQKSSKRPGRPAPWDDGDESEPDVGG